MPIWAEAMVCRQDQQDLGAGVLLLYIVFREGLAQPPRSHRPWAKAGLCHAMLCLCSPISSFLAQSRPAIFISLWAWVIYCKWHRQAVMHPRWGSSSFSCEGFCWRLAGPRLGNCFTLAIMVFTLDVPMFKSLAIFVISREAVALFSPSIWVGRWGSY